MEEPRTETRPPLSEEEEDSNKFLEEMEMAISLSLQEMVTPSKSSDEELDEMTLQMILSLSELEQRQKKRPFKTMPLSPVTSSKDNKKACEILLLPNKEIARKLFDLRYHFRLSYGVCLEFLNSRTLLITGDSDDATAIAKDEIEAMLSNADLIEVKSFLLKEETVEIFIDHSPLPLPSGAAVSSPAVFKPPLLPIPPPPPPQQENKKISSLQTDERRISARALDALLCNGRTATKRVIAGATETSALRDHLSKKWQALHYHSVFVEQKRAKKESLIESELTAALREAINQPVSPVSSSVTLALVLSEDSGEEIWSVINEALARQWKVELWAWKTQLPQRYLSNSETYLWTGLFRVFYLDDYLDLLLLRTNNKMKRKKNSCSSGARSGLRALFMKGSRRKTNQEEEEDDDDDEDSEREDFDDLFDEEELNPPPPPPSSGDNSNSNRKEKEEEEDFTCPITMELYEDPVKTKYGHIFERKTIEEWLALRSTCPLTNQQLESGDLKEVEPVFKQRLEAFKDKKKKKK